MSRDGRKGAPVRVDGARLVADYGPSYTTSAGVTGMGRSRKDPIACSFAGCKKPARVRGLCHTHAMQRYRGAPLTPVRERRGGPCVRLPGLSISAEAAKKLEEVGPTAYRAARELIESWAEGGCGSKASK